MQNKKQTMDVIEFFKNLRFWRIIEPFNNVTWNEK